MRHFEILADPRIKRRKLHKLHDIVFITIAAVLCGCDEWNDIEAFGQIRYDWPKTILGLPRGIPPHDTFNRVFSPLEPQQLQQCFTNWVLRNIKKGWFTSYYQTENGIIPNSDRKAYKTLLLWHVSKLP